MLNWSLMSLINPFISVVFPLLRLPMINEMVPEPRARTFRGISERSFVIRPSHDYGVQKSRRYRTNGCRSGSQPPSGRFADGQSRWTPRMSRTSFVGSGLAGGCTGFSSRLTVCCEGEEGRPDHTHTLHGGIRRFNCNPGRAQFVTIYASKPRLPQKFPSRVMALCRAANVLASITSFWEKSFPGVSLSERSGKFEAFG